MENSLEKIIVELETKLLLKATRVQAMHELLAEDFIEVGQGNKPATKTDVLSHTDFHQQDDIPAEEFQIKPITKHCVLLNYITRHTDRDTGGMKKMIRSSIWRLRDDQ
ncbi:DUF4440 domain-containing protein [Legionella dresdenensis]|uniref:DUF4440 domain-containing protein n=1 Tax=Legionella dresdenensis TaxID=450200 RepID=A0ABV8CID1_9GAMM